MPAQSIQGGSTSLGSLTVAGLQVGSMVFPPSLTLPSHYHPNACFALVLKGAVEKLFASGNHTTEAGSVVTMPPEERHTDRFGGGGAHMLVIEVSIDEGNGDLSDSLEALLHPCLPVFRQISHYRQSDVVSMGWRVYRELQEPDPVSCLAVSGLVLEMLACTVRNYGELVSERQAPPWLESAREYLHAHFDRSFQIGDVAEAVGVHPVHLARTFRRHYGTSPSSYLRRLRVNWVARQLAQVDEQMVDVPLSYLAEQAGFADQSHLTRLFKRQTGLTPGQYRQVVQSGH